MNTTDPILSNELSWPPDEILVKGIYSLLGPKDLCQCEQVNKLWQKCIAIPLEFDTIPSSTFSLWDRLYRRTFVIHPEDKTLYSKGHYKAAQINANKKINKDHPLAILPNELKTKIFSFLVIKPIVLDTTNLQLVQKARTVSHFFNRFILANSDSLDLCKLPQLSNYLCKFLTELRSHLIWHGGIKTLLTNAQPKYRAAISICTRFLKKCLDDHRNDGSKKRLLMAKDGLTEAILRNEMSALDTLVIDENLLTKHNLKNFHKISAGLLDLFIILGISIDTLDELQWSVWHYACHRLNVKAIKILIGQANSKDIINTQTQRQRTFLHYVVYGLPPTPSIYQRTCALKIVKLLISHGATPDIKDRDGISPIDLALNRDDPELLAILDPNNKHLSSQGINSLAAWHFVQNYPTSREIFYEISKQITKNRAEIERIQKLVDQDNHEFLTLGNSNKELLEYFALIKFAPKKADEMIKLLIKEKILFKFSLMISFYQSVLMAIHENNQENAIAILLHADLDVEQVDKYFPSILREAEEKNQTELMHFLFTQAPTFCLYHTLYLRNSRLLQFFLNFPEASAYVNRTYQDFEAPLHLAVSQQDLESMQHLLAHEDIEVDVRDCLGRTPLQIAMLKGNDQCIKLLLENGADLDAFDD